MPPAALIASSRPGLLSILLVLVVRPLDMKANMHLPKMVSTAPRHDRQRGGSASAFWPWACPRALFARQSAAVTPSRPLYRFDPIGGFGTSIWGGRSEEHTSELQSLMRISYAVFCLKKKKK